MLYNRSCFVKRQRKSIFTHAQLLDKLRKPLPDGGNCHYTKCYFTTNVKGRLENIQPASTNQPGAAGRIR
jgi:hypothetical protein